MALTTNDKLNIIINNYDYTKQDRQTMEEMGELAQALNKFWRYDLKNGKIKFYEAMNCNLNDDTNSRIEDIITEIADVQICLDQLKKFFNVEEKVEKVYRQKIDREFYSKDRLGFKDANFNK